MASKLMDRLRRTLFKEGEVVSKEPIDVTEERFPESSELEDDTECLSERLGGTLCFDGESALESEDPGEASGPDSDSDYLGESIEDGFSSTDTSPVGPSPGGSSLLTRQLQDSWRSLRFRSVPQKLVFEVTDASVVQESSSKYVLYTIHLIQSGMFDEIPAAITRRYTDFKRLHSCLRRRHRDNMERVGFPRKKLRKNFVAETIAKRSRAFEQYLTHMHSLAELRRSPTFLEFFYLGDLQAGQMLMRVGRYQEALGPLLNGLRLQEKLGCEEQGKQQPHHQQGTHWLFTLLALVTCFQELEQLGEAQEHCDRALRDLAPSPEALQQHHFHPLLIPLLQTNVRLSWKISKDKRQWEVLLQEIQDSGADTGNQPSLKEYLIKETLVESEGDTKAKLKREKAT
ncbi:sorting nexin-21-like isoform X1 [Oncorhynchus tshawytscha]|uniref:Sorting nexin family member 21 n=2 Tax=Oncorhynchus TaxID=8016 RepID=A0A8C7CVN4_ONCKI|nr:sorting nexin-21 [Oncorhynchus kisutch]XP_020361925.1 sorting nexin-21 [Oncorhynchus kisutch]XP_024255607.1 sorting nexin-21-like isoform X1 [Oncorhynchus tshawytscha]XP_031650041.1 sorting nexin-21 [Oncorhynchus kisutch]